MKPFVKPVLGAIKTKHALDMKGIASRTLFFAVVSLSVLYMQKTWSLYSDVLK